MPDQTPSTALGTSDQRNFAEAEHREASVPPQAVTPAFQGGTVVDRRVFNDRRTLRDPRTGELVYSEPVGGTVDHNAPHEVNLTGGVSAEDNIVKPAVTRVTKANSGEGGSAPTGLERRRGRGRRLSDFSRAAEEGEMTSEQFLFLMAIDEFKKANEKTFPQWTDVLEVIRLLGYRKTMPSELKLRRAQDWQEAENAPSNVRPRNWASRLAA